MAQGLTLGLVWIAASAGGLAVLLAVLGAVATWDLRNQSEVYNTRRRLEALLEKDRRA